MEVPEKKNILLGMPWLEKLNPEINWKEKHIKHRESEESTTFNSPTLKVAGARISQRETATKSHTTQDDLMMYYTKHTLVSPTGETQVISTETFQKQKRSDEEFCYFVNVASEKVARQLSTDWEAIRGHPVEPVVLKYKGSVFVSELPSTPPTRTVDVEAEIELNDTTPVVRKQFRLIHDFRAINARVRVPATPIPRKEDIYDAMAKGRLFSALDFTLGFLQVRLRERDIPYTAFSTPDGLFEYLVTPMGLSSSPSAINRLMQAEFSDLSEFCRAYFDDLFIFTSTDSVDDHLAALDKVLARCEQQQLFVKIAKCTFCAEEIPCLGDYIGHKIRTIQEWPEPRTKREMQSFLGTCVYVLKYCPDFSSLAAPLTEATRGRAKNERITLTTEQLYAFRELKRRLASPPILAHSDSTLPFHVKTDASDHAVGGYLFQIDAQGHGKMIAYGGRKVNSAERMYPTREKELP
ncbi:Polyprotein [Phytophthora palmivora]|uniref:Polyprotein n=1 Tax=Phytophthora palmivora TaxID=4796 RepID=A0A2P4XVS3_9STRA|nr:Polyprotein [Phytophthora palmivora]